ncbi:DUF5685 family protein [Nonomuraea typhae]|uniref:DUF5685 family protein n=1 Tax=Nonomuraea typhae TaxID=2603600 RepID=UPI001C721F7E|nr:DUF5685 family protein [Nonomuraea typhae]
MFGIVRPCRHGMCGGMFKDWLGHLCGLCVALRDEHGQAARLATNYDALLVSVLTEAQTASPPRRRTAAPCALRGFRTADIVQSEGVRLAATVSLILAAGKLRDHIADGDGPYRRRPVAVTAGRLARRWSARATASASALAFDPAPLTGAAAAQLALERSTAVLSPESHSGTARLEPSSGTARLESPSGTARPESPFGAARPESPTGTARPESPFGAARLGRSSAAVRPGASGSASSGAAGLALLTAPTEDAVAAAFAHTAVLAGRPGNREPLERAGRSFGRLAHLLDAVEDLDDDRRRGAYNPLLATGASLSVAREHCDRAQSELRAAFADLDLSRPDLAGALLVKETSRAVNRAFTVTAGRSSGAPSPEAPAPGPPSPGEPGSPSHHEPHQTSGLFSLACAAFSCCTCGLYEPPAEDGESRCGRCRDCGDACCQGCDCCSNCSDCDCCSGCDCCPS